MTKQVYCEEECQVSDIDFQKQSFMFEQDEFEGEECEEYDEECEECWEDEAVEDVFERQTREAYQKIMEQNVRAVYTDFLDEEIAKMGDVDCTMKVVVPKTAQVAPTEKEMQDEFEAFLAVGRREREVDATAEETKQFLLDLKKAQEMERAETKKIQAGYAVKIAEASAEQGRKRFESKARAPNAKGKEQGVKKAKTVDTKGKRATRREEQSKNITIVPARENVVQQIALVPSGNVKSKTQAPARSADVEAEIEEVEEVEQFLIPLVPVDAPLFPTEIAKPLVEVVKPVEEEEWTTVKKAKTAVPKGMSVEDIKVGTSIIETARNASRASRESSKDTHVSSEQVEGPTVMCRSYGTKTSCKHGKNCRFAHHPEELVRRECSFGNGCRYCVSLGNGQYINKPGEHTGRVCSFWHPQENLEMYCARTGIVYKKMQVPEPVKIQLVKPVQVQQTVKQATPAPWAKPVQLAQPVRKSRWDVQ